MDSIWFNWFWAYLGSKMQKWRFLIQYGLFGGASLPNHHFTDIITITLLHFFSDRPYVFWVAYANYLPIDFFSGACFLVCIFFVFIYLFLGGVSSYLTEETVLCIQCLLITVLCLILLFKVTRSLITRSSPHWDSNQQVT